MIPLIPRTGYIVRSYQIRLSMHEELMDIVPPLLVNRLESLGKFIKRIGIGR